MKKQELAKAVANSTSVPEAKVTEVLNATLAAIVDELKNGGEVALPGFGTFKTTSRPSRTGRNPQTGASIEIPASTNASFKASSALKKTLSE